MGCSGKIGAHELEERTLRAGGVVGPSSSTLLAWMRRTAGMEVEEAELQTEAVGSLMRLVMVGLVVDFEIVPSKDC